MLHYNTSVVDISIHAPLRERLKFKFVVFGNPYFNPRSLAGATVERADGAIGNSISIHAPLRERRLAKFEQEG